MKKFIFIGFNHNLHGPRLFYRQMRVLKEKSSNCEIMFVTNEIINGNDTIIEEKDINVLSFKVKHIHIKIGGARKRIRQLHKQSAYKKMLPVLRRLFCEYRPDVIQASDVRELRIVRMASKEISCKIVYDSHEDYIRQAIDFNNNNRLIGYVIAFKHLCDEMLYVRSYDAVFCTDDFLLKKYKNWIYGAKSVNLLRNYPFEANLTVRYKRKDTIRLVYIGNVNKHRGVIECAEYVHKYNLRNSKRKLRLTIISKENSLLKWLKEKKMVEVVNWMNYDQLMKHLKKYDIGVCLWMPIPKFFRNLPLKNFDYMSVGLPILTSNFGNMKRYLEGANAGICIDPRNYEQFERAIDVFFNEEKRMECGLSGCEWVKESGNFVEEAKRYVEEYYK